jgi:hypothetical protein
MEILSKMKTFQFHVNGTLPSEDDRWCFVFGSNTRGLHGAGGAKVARDKYGAVMGQGDGFSPSLTSYAIPTKDKYLNVLTLDVIKQYIDKFVEITHAYPQVKFFITAVGCGLAGYKHSQIAVLFKDCNNNCSFPDVWKTYLTEVPTKCYYTGIGSRETPTDILNLMASIGAVLAKRNIALRSGAAKGADSAFEEGCDSVNGLKEIWIPWKFFEKRDSNYLPGPDHYRLAATLHPVWDRLTKGARALHARNTGQILGVDLKTPSQFVVCYTRDAVESHDKVSSKTGGTGTAIKLASLNNIPVFNLAIENRYNAFLDFLETLS